MRAQLNSFPLYLQAVIDHETWVMDLEEANKGTRPRWFQLYSARRAYGLRSLHPQEWDMLINRMTEDDDLFDLYHRSVHFKYCFFSLSLLNDEVWIYFSKLDIRRRGYI